MTTSPGPGPSESTDGQIVKSSLLIGGSTAVNVVVSIVRVKAMAVLLGPAGFGLFGLFSSISELARTFVGLGVNSSGVRQIAEAVGSGAPDRVACTVATLRRVSLLLGATGALLIALF